MESFNKLKFTIVIPTRERSDTLIHTLKTVLSQDYDYFNVLISDNASNDNTKDLVLSFDDERLIYINTGKRISMSENWEFALNHINKGWITILGDDDGLLPGCLDRVNDIYQKTHTRVIRSNSCQFVWPDVLDSTYGELDISISKGFKVLESKKILQDVLDGLRGYTELPTIYNGGFTSIDLIKQVKSDHERFFMSMTPDVYSGIILALMTETYTYTQEALVINGASVHSNGTAFFKGITKSSKYNPAKKFMGEKNISLHKDIPTLNNGMPVRSIQIIVYEAYLQAKKYYPSKLIDTSHAKQLQLALSKAGIHYNEVCEWAAIFSKKHNLSIKDIQNNVSLFTRLKKNYKIYKRRMLTSTIVGTKKHPINNVYEASKLGNKIKYTNSRLCMLLKKN